MTARAGMANLILRLRGLTNTTSSDYTLGATTYWSDDQLQDILDATRKDWRGVPLEAMPELGTTGSYEYYDYRIPVEIGRDFEEAGASSIFAVKETGGAIVSSGTYTVNYRAGILRFTVDQDAAFYTIDVRTFSLNSAAREVWEQKAGHCVANVTWKSDNHAVNASEEYDHCMAMAERFRKLGSGWQVVTIVRSDEIS